MTQLTKEELADYELRINDDLARHRVVDDCDCPFKCPKCPGQAHWDLVLEGHYCPKCSWYDGVK